MNNTLFRWRAPLPPLKLSATVVVVVIAVAVAAVNAARDDTTVPANASETTTATAACALCRQYCSGGRDAVVDDVTTDASTDRTAQCACGIGCDGDRLSVPRDGGRKESRWCWTVIANLETVSIMFVFVTFNVYAWVLKQRGTSNHVKHYLAFFSILLSIRRFKRNFCPEQDPCDERPINVFGTYIGAKKKNVKNILCLKKSSDYDGYNVLLVRRRQRDFYNEFFGFLNFLFFFCFNLPNKKRVFTRKRIRHAW